MSADFHTIDLPERASADEHNRARAYVLRKAPDLLAMLDLEEER